MEANYENFKDYIEENNFYFCYVCKNKSNPIYSIVDDVTMLHAWAERSMAYNTGSWYSYGRVCSEACFNLLLLQSEEPLTSDVGYKKTKSKTFEKNRKCACGKIHKWINLYGYSFR